MKVHVCHVVYTYVVYVIFKFNTSIVHLLIRFQQGNIKYLGFSIYRLGGGAGWGGGGGGWWILKFKQHNKNDHPF